jgi:hypothetical protein
MVMTTDEKGNLAEAAVMFAATSDVDVFASYSGDLEECFLLPPELWANRRMVQLRIAPTRNNQRRGVHWARDYEFAARIRSFGAVAQLGERESGTLEVTGSIPVGSIVS